MWMGEHLPPAPSRPASTRRLWPDDVPVNDRHSTTLPPRVHLAITDGERADALSDTVLALGHALPVKGKSGLAVVLRDYARMLDKGSKVQVRDTCIRAAAWFMREGIRIDREIAEKHQAGRLD